MINTKVVNVKVANIRPGYQSLSNWMNNDNNVYIGRKGVVFINKERFPKEDSIWHNPFKIDTKDSRNDVIRKYEIYIKKKLDEEPDLVNKLLKLKGKNLGCWCYPLECHGNVLIKMINYYSMINDASNNK